jgi:hypothetical protein
MVPEVRAKRGIILAQRQMIPAIRCHKGAGRAELTRKGRASLIDVRGREARSRAEVARRKRSRKRGKVEAPGAHPIVRAAENRAERASSSHA